MCLGRQSRAHHDKRMNENTQRIAGEHRRSSMQRPKSMPILVTPTSTIRGVSIAIFLTMLWSCAAALPGVQLESSRKVAPRCSGGFPPRVARCRCGHWETRVKLGQAGRRRYTLSVFPKDRQGRRVPQELAFPYCRARKRLQRAGQKFRRLDAGHYKRGIVAGFLRAGAAPSGENARIGVDPQRLVLDPKDEAPLPYFLLPSLEPHERVGETCMVENGELAGFAPRVFLGEVRRGA